jgi:hypothetical protein
MSPPRYRLVAIDLDGTLIPDDLQVRPRVRQAIRRALDADVHVTLATGRAFPDTARYALELGIDVPVICYQGGLIQHPRTGELLYRATMPRELALEAIELAARDDLDLNLYVRDEIFVTRLRHDEDFYQKWFGLPVHPVGDLKAALTDDPTKFIIIAEEAEADRIHPAWKAHFQGRLQIVRSHRLFVEGNPLGVSKGHALARLAAHLGVRREETIAIGDNDNDRAMIEWAGLGVAMGNAPASLQAIADYVAPPVAEDGVAEVFERFIQI